MDRVSSDGAAPSRQRSRIRVEGVVQGVGFRPFVHALATELGLAGHVGNDAGGVVIEVEGEAGGLASFVERLQERLPPLADIERLQITRVRPRGQSRFEIVASGAGASSTLVSADVATCDACLAELGDPQDRRFAHPFINCTDCGPRYTIVRRVPYDRATTTMASFARCEDCEVEYHDPSDRRFHAQPICCPACGPTLRAIDGHGARLLDDPVSLAAEQLRVGAVVAVKGLGGYHLAVDATNERATAALRAAKHREEKPFAVMVPDLAAARGLCEVSAAEAALLTGPARPIVLLRRRAGGQVAPSVAPGDRRIGLMLPYTPLHHLLLAAVARPIVLTSGNVSDEPIAYDDEDARDRLGPMVSLLLTHDRAIHVRVDDSVAHVVAGRPQLLRRARGYAPRPVPLADPLPRHVLALGAELKSTVCLARGRHAFVSHHIGDLENYETYRAFTAATTHVAELFAVLPDVVAHDLHPEYLSTKHALELAEAPPPGSPAPDLVGVQHHHAHIASCLADNRESGPVIGLALDGTGFGTDGTLWGGEVLIADLVGSTRAGHLEVVAMPGGTAAVREPWRMAAAHLDAAFEGHPPDRLAVVRRNEARWGDVLAVARAGINSPPTSSVGRLFDAVAAILSVRDTITYEGQAAIQLEQRADPNVHGGYESPLLEGDPFVLSAAALVRAVVHDVLAGIPEGVIAARFHGGVAALFATACARVREGTGLTTVALSGGVFQNVLLLERTLAALEATGFRVLTHQRVPPNDAGISLGQAVIAGARDRLR